MRHFLADGDTESGMRRSVGLSLGVGVLLVVVAVTWVATRDRSSPAGSPRPSRRRGAWPVRTVRCSPESFVSSTATQSPSSDRTIDARRARLVSFPSDTLYPLALGSSEPAQRVCVIGGLVEGQQSRTLTWDEMKERHDGAGARVAGKDWYVVDGLRVSNLEDGIDPRGTPDRVPQGRRRLRAPEPLLQLHTGRLRRERRHRRWPHRRQPLRRVQHGHLRATDEGQPAVRLPGAEGRDPAA